MRLKYIFLLLQFLIAGIQINGQQLPTYSQYMMNGFLLNPAVAGHEGYTAINVTVREQWVGLKDAPSTYALSLQTRLLKNSFISRSASIKRRRRVMSRSGRVGLGLYGFSDWNGAFNRSGLQFTYAYHLTMAKSQLSFAASITTYQFKIDPEKITLLQESDRLLAATNKSAIIPDANFGIYFTNKDLFAGFSALQLFESAFRFADRSGASFKLVRHYYLTAGYRFGLIDFVLMEPSILLKTTDDFLSQLDINLKFYFKEDYWAGLSYRSGGGYSIHEESLSGRGASFIIMGGVRVDRIYLGYSFDYTFAALAKRTFGSHEIMLAVKFGDNARRYRWLNRY